MTFDDCVKYMDDIKLKLLSRFKHQLEVNAQLEDRINQLEARIAELEDVSKGWECLLKGAIVIQDENVPLSSAGRKREYPPWYKTHGLKGPPH